MSSPFFTGISHILMYSVQDRSGPVWTGFLRFFAVPVRGSGVLEYSRTGPGPGPAKNGQKTGPDRTLKHYAQMIHNLSQFIPSQPYL